MKLTVKNKEYEIKFGYRVTSKSGILRELATFIKKVSELQDLDAMEEMMLWLPNFLLIGLQKNHQNEFGYDLDNKEERAEKLDKVFELLDEYFEQEDTDVMDLFEKLQKELLQDGFLSKQFHAEQAKVEKKAKATEN